MLAVPRAKHVVGDAASKLAARSGERDPPAGARDHPRSEELLEGEFAHWVVQLHRTVAVLLTRKQLDEEASLHSAWRHDLHPQRSTLGRPKIPVEV